jgi:hypothetical protein
MTSGRGLIRMPPSPRIAVALFDNLHPSLVAIDGDSWPEPKSFGWSIPVAGR